MAAPLSAGQLIRAKYRVERVLGEGGMGVVVSALHLGLDQRVAIKFLLPAKRAKPDVVERFAREARAAAKLQSDHVARVTDVDQLEDGTPYMVMEYLEGNDLSAVRRAGRPLPLAMAVGYIIEACEAIAEAHSLGIIHRDIKPANLFLARRPDGSVRVKVLDFGISKITGVGALTQADTAIGSAEYMAPEQMRAAREVDGRADVWALGVTLFELSTAHSPFAGASMSEVIWHVLNDAPPPPSTFRMDFSAGLESVILKCLEKDVANRFATVADLAIALRPFGPGVSPAVVGPPVSNPLPPPEALPIAIATAASVAGSVQRVTGSTKVDPAPPPSVTGSVQRTTGPTKIDPARASAPIPAVTADAPVAPASVSTSGSNLTPQAGPSRVPLFIGFAVLALLLVGVLILQIRNGSQSVPAATAESAAPAISNPPTAAPIVVSAATNNAVAPAPSASLGPSRADEKSDADSHSAAAPVHSASTRAASPAPQAAPKTQRSRVDCASPFIVDANGVKHAKPECF